MFTSVVLQFNHSPTNFSSSLYLICNHIYKREEKKTFFHMCKIIQGQFNIFVNLLEEFG